MAIAGFLLVAHQLRAATQDRLYAHYNEICKLFMGNSELQPYFYRLATPHHMMREADGARRASVTFTASIEPHHFDATAQMAGAAPAEQMEERKKLAAKVDFMCELLLGLIEHAVLQRWYMPSDCWHQCWHPYALQRLEESSGDAKILGAELDLVLYRDAARDEMRAS